MATSASPLEVDGFRPSVAWVSTLPETWTIPSQRMLLYVLACDAFHDVSRASGRSLSAWVGLSRSRTFELLGELSRPVPGVRPELLERVDRHGKPLPAGKHWGGVVGYRLRTEHTEPSDIPDGYEPSEGPDGYWGEPSEISYGSEFPEPSGYPDGYEPSEPSGRSDKPSEEPSDLPDTPFPREETPSSFPRAPFDRASNDDGLRPVAELGSWRDLARAAGDR